MTAKWTVLLLLALTAITLVAVAPICWVVWIADGLIRERRWRHVWWELPGQEAVSLTRQPAHKLAHDDRQD